MNRLGFKSVVYHGDVYLGVLEAVPVEGSFQFPNNEIRINRISTNSERCHPLSVLQTVAYSSVRCKLEPCSNGDSNCNYEQSPLINLHAACFYELKTAVVLHGSEEIHLVAMPSKQKKFPCFWCYSVPCGLYDTCLWMLNTRCLAIVFDLDETLIVANTMKSFEDRIEALTAWIGRETDPIRESGMTAEMKRYIEDRALLKQYAETDSVVDSGRVYNMQQEEVILNSGETHRVVRPVVRLPEKSIVLTRINPENRDTSVLVRLRPAWDELKNYLIARERKRFEVFVCTLAERDYALEMWRLLDPEARLINAKQLLDRVVCVKAGSRKSLLNVFQDGSCHPSMAMVIDDRMKVWEDMDQPRVHVVPPFTPYYSPQAETANSLAVLCVARNVACNVRTCFFKEFDENLLRRISEIFYEDEAGNLPCAPDVSNYMISEDASFMPNGNPNAPFAEGMVGQEVAQRFRTMEEKAVESAVSRPLPINNSELKPESSNILPPSASSGIAALASTKGLLPSGKPSLFGDLVRRDSRSRSMEPPLISKVPWPDSSHRPSQGGWLVEEDTNGANSGGQDSVVPQESDPLNGQRGRQNLIKGATLCSTSEQPHVPQVRNGESNTGYDVSSRVSTQANNIAESGLVNHHSQPPFEGGETKVDGVETNLLQSLSVRVLQEIGRRCNSKVEFKVVARASSDLGFSVEVFYTGEKIGSGIGKTRKDAHQQAAENALRNLADGYISHVSLRSGMVVDDSHKPSLDNENGFLWDPVKPASEEPLANNGFSKHSASEV